MSKILSPRAWYLVGIGATALAVDGARRLIRKRRQATVTVEGIELEQSPASGTTVASSPVTAPRPNAAPAAIETPPAARTSAIALTAAKTSPAPKHSAAQKGDDLTQLKGIGPTFARRLNEAGITTFAAVAAAKPDYLREVTRANAAANPDEWIAEAHLK